MESTPNKNKQTRFRKSLLPWTLVSQQEEEEEYDELVEGSKGMVYTESQ